LPYFFRIQSKSTDPGLSIGILRALSQTNPAAHPMALETAKMTV
jgi:hypothetical protein